MKIEISIEKEYEGEEEGMVELSKLPPALRKKVAKYMSTKKPEKPMRFDADIDDQVRQAFAELGEEEKELDEKIEAYRTEWMLNAFIGALKVSEKKAGEILSRSRDDRTKDQQAVYYRASNSFKYHIVRAEDATPAETPKSHARVAVPKVKVEQAVKLFAGMTREQINALVDRALSQITFE